MSPASDRTRIVSQEAAYWYIRSFDERAMPRADRELFVAWLKRSPENIAEFLRVIEMDGGLAGRRLNDCAADLKASNIIDGPFGSSAAQDDYQPSDTVSDQIVRKETAASAWRMAAALAAFAVTLLLGFAILDRSSNDVVETLAAQWQQVTLDDGSTVYLDARTRLKTEFTPQRRLVHLYHGWAVFNVAKDSRRPFTVSTDPIEVTAVGTRFGVAIDIDVTTTVEEGTVEVTTRGKQNGSAVRLHEGQELRIRSAGNSTPSEADIVAVDAKTKLLWVTGRVELKDTTIGEIIRQFNRRQEIQAEVATPGLADRPVDLALMQVDNVDSFIEVMESEGVAVSRKGSTLTLRASRMD
ncbi:MAG: FecR domain-containing protein [Pseudomonadota bacterium]|nr:FecR domain-containing protein [Pseudomonadota bacterium]